MKKLSYSQHIFFFLLFFLFFIVIAIHAISAFAQDNETGLKFNLILDIYVTKEDKKTPLSDAKIVITQGANVIVQDEVGTDGHNSFNIPLNKGNFVITISKSGYISKKINVKSKVPKYNQDYEWGFAIDLFQKVDINKVGTKYFTYLKNQSSEFVLGGEILDQPVSTIFFDPTIKEFNYDKEYAAWMKNKIAELSQAQKADLIADAEAKANGRPLPSIAKKAAEAKAKADAEAKAKIKAAEDAKAKAEAERIVKEKEMAEKLKQEAALKAYNEAERLKKEAEANKLQANKNTKNEYLAKIDEAVAETESKKKQEQTTKQENFEQLKREANEKAMFALLKMQEEERIQRDERNRKEIANERKIKENKRIKYENSNPFKDLLDAAAEYEVVQKKKTLQKK